LILPLRVRGDGWQRWDSRSVLIVSNCFHASQYYALLVIEFSVSWKGGTHCIQSRASIRDYRMARSMRTMYDSSSDAPQSPKPAKRTCNVGDFERIFNVHLCHELDHQCCNFSEEYI
jgi:hypothetical protein